MKARSRPNPWSITLAGVLVFAIFGAWCVWYLDPGPPSSIAESRRTIHTARLPQPQADELQPPGLGIGDKTELRTAGAVIVAYADQRAFDIISTPIHHMTDRTNTRAAQVYQQKPEGGFSVIGWDSFTRILEERVLTLADGTLGTVLEIAVGRRRVRLLAGPHKGRAIWVAAENCGPERDQAERPGLSVGKRFVLSRGTRLCPTLESPDPSDGDASVRYIRGMQDVPAGTEVIVVSRHTDKMGGRCYFVRAGAITGYVGSGMLAGRGPGRRP